MEIPEAALQGVEKISGKFAIEVRTPLELCIVCKEMQFDLLSIRIICLGQ